MLIEADASVSIVASTWPLEIDVLYANTGQNTGQLHARNIVQTDAAYDAVKAQYLTKK